MQEDHRNGQDDNDTVETSEPFTITRAALYKHIMSSADHNYQLLSNQPEGHLSASLSGREGSEKIFEEFQVT